MTHFSIVLENPSAVRDLAIQYAKVAKAVGDDQGYEFFNILRERVEEAQYGLTMKAREAEEELALEWRCPKHFPRYGVNRHGEVFDFANTVKLEPEELNSVMQYRMMNEYGCNSWFTSATLLRLTWPELMED